MGNTLMNMYYQIDFGRIGKISKLFLSSHTHCKCDAGCCFCAKENMGYRPPPPPPRRSWSLEKCLDAAHDSNHLEQLLKNHNPEGIVKSEEIDWPEARRRNHPTDYCKACNASGIVPTSIVDGTEDMRECSNCTGTGWIQKIPIEVKGSIVWRERDQYTSTDRSIISHRGTRGSGGLA